LRQFADNPKVGAREVYDLVASVVNTPLAPKVQAFLHTVLDNGRLAVLPEIAAQLTALVNAQSGVSEATIESAFPIEGAQLADLKATLEKRFARKLDTSVVVKPELIGGIRVVVGDEVLDASVAARLQQMKTALVA
jgi:F-type H+-transporting ATPase subunit delta